MAMFVANVLRMELTAQTLREVTFGQKVRGYDPADVDDFIDQVADGLDELHDRLRRADERAAAAEASGSSAAFAAPAAPSASDIGKVWERAAEAAEAAVEEARQEAARILEEARSNAAAAEAAVEDARAEAARLREDARNQARHEADQTLQAARQEAESTIGGAREESENAKNSARAEAEATLNNARAEAARLAEESQGELRTEIASLEEARDILKSNVSVLSSYLDAELEKVRNALQGALSAIEHTAEDRSEAPSVDAVDVPAPRYGGGVQPTMSSDGYTATGAATYADTPAYGDSSTSDTPAYEEAVTSYAETPSYGQDSQYQETQSESSYSQDQPAQYGQSDYSDEQPATNFTEGSSPWDAGVREDELAGSQTGEAESEIAPWEREDVAAADNAQWQAPAWPSPDDPADQNPVAGLYDHREDSDDEVDPFLAELRRAVHDEGPLGPREDPDTSIDNLYSDDDDDKNGFFRRKK